MTQLFIDNKPIEIDQKTRIAISLSIASVNNPAESSTSFTKTIKIPITISNRLALGFTEQVYSKDRFNNAEHKSRIEVDGVVVMSGTAVMKEINIADKGYYNINIIGSELSWVKRAQGKLTNLRSTEGVVYSESGVASNAATAATASPLVRFIPIDKGAFFTKDAEGNYTPRTTLEIRDYHPFLNLWKVMELIFGGYRLVCPIAWKLKRIYFPGAITEPEDMSEIIAENEFCAGVATTKTIGAEETANRGYSYTVIDTVDDDAIPPVMFGNGVAEIRRGGRTSPYLLYTPKSSCKVSFDVTLSCTIAPRQLSYIGNNPDNNNFGVANPTFVDRYMIEIPDRFIGYHEILNEQILIDNGFTKYLPEGSIKTSGNAYITFFIELNNPERYEGLYFKDKNGWEKCRVYSDQKQYFFHTSNWGEQTSVYVREDGVLKLMNIHYLAQEVFGLLMYRITVDSVPPLQIEKEYNTEKIIELKENEPVEVWTHMLTRRGYADIQINEGTTIAPNFSSGIAHGSTVSIDNIGGDTKQIDVIQAARQMFNLMFYTNDLTREITIKPMNVFYEPVITDWSNKMDLSEEILIEELGADIGTYLKLGYQEGNDVVKAYNRRNKTELGTHKFMLENKTSSTGTELSNNLFQPSITRRVGSMVYAPQLVPEKEQQSLDEVEFNIDPIVVEVVENTDTTVRYKYPIAAFQQYGANLGFTAASHSNTITPGLAQYYEDNIRQYNRGKKITAYMKLTPTDIESVLYYNRYKRDFRSCFLLKINAEEVICHLESIDDYDPLGGVTKCQFVYFIPEVKEQPTLSLSHSAVTFPASGGIEEITVDSDTFFDAKIQGAGFMHVVSGNVVCIKAPANVGFERTAQLIVRSAGNTLTLNITQKSTIPTVITYSDAIITYGDTVIDYYK